MSCTRCSHWRKLGLTLVFWLACIGLVLADAPPVASAAKADASQAKTLIAGILVNDQENAQSINLLQSVDGSYAVDVDQFAAALQTRVHTDHGQLRIPTPLGNATISAAVVIQRDSARYVPVMLLAHVLASKIRFDPTEYALRADLPWTPGASDNDASSANTPYSGEKPDIRAPVASLSAIHSEADLSSQNGNNTFSTLTELQGALGPGSWRSTILTISPGGRSVMQNYGWTVDSGDSRLYLGNSQLNLDPLLPYANLTGAQYVWSTRPDISYGNDIGSNEVVASQSMSGQGLSGKDGPPGGIAELRVNGKVVARANIQLDGTWQFNNIVLRSTDFAEVALYERFGDGVPTRIVQVNSATSTRSLPAGTIVSYAGLGADGNPLDPYIGTHGMGGFYQVRWGVNDQLTVDATVQQTDGRDYGVSNAIVGLGPVGTWDFGLSQSSSGADAWNIQGNGQHGMWYWDGYVLQREANFFPEVVSYGVDSMQSVRYGEFGVHVSPSLDVSLVGGDSHDAIDGQNFRYLKPAVNWRVTDNFSLSARPDYDGSYDYSANWAVSSATRVTLSRYDGITQLDMLHLLSDGLQLDLAATQEPILGTRYSQTLSGMWASAHALSWSVGLLEANSRIGYLLDAAMETIPGLSVHMQAYNDPLNHGVNGGTIFQLSVVADFAVTPSGLARGGYSAQAIRRGAISGKVFGDLPDNVKLSDLAGVEVLVDGKPSGTLDSRGHYLVNNLSPGVHLLELDSDKLPIDLMPPAEHPLVEVRAGATTRADFALSLRLGFAGCVKKIDGEPAVDVPVIAIDAHGQVVAIVKTDSLGYYRVDQLRPGTYTIRTDHHDRSVTLVRSFVFGQDFTIEITPDPAISSDKVTSIPKAGKSN